LWLSAVGVRVMAWARTPSGMDVRAKKIMGAIGFPLPLHLSLHQISPTMMPPTRARDVSKTASPPRRGPRSFWINDDDDDDDGDDALFGFTLMFFFFLLCFFFVLTSCCFYSPRA
jgi:hypothetical protein